MLVLAVLLGGVGAIAYVWANAMLAGGWGALGAVGILFVIGAVTIILSEH